MRALLRLSTLRRHSAPALAALGALQWPRALSAKGGAAAPPAAKGAKKARGPSGPEASLVSKELREAYVVGANILKDGSDPPVRPDSEYPDWLWHLLDKQAPLSELKRKDVEKLDEKEYMRLGKLDNRRDIKEKNASRAKG
eukprot:SM000054S18097  [mRNA]  locus=s54:468964:470050:+ [translate_table: standard]